MRAWVVPARPALAPALLFLGLALGAGCIEADPEEEDLYPAIAVSACRASNQADDCLADFGEVLPGETGSMRVDVQNTSQLHALTLDVLLTANTEDAFALDEAIEDVVVPAQSIYVFNISFAPTLAGTYTGKATLYSDAGRPRPGPVEILLVGYGAD